MITVVGCECCENTGRIECLPDDSTHTHPCDECQPGLLKEFNRGVAFGESQAQPDNAALRLKLTRWLTLLQDIVACAGSNPQGLTSFNSPILQRAVQEIYLHNNPGAEDDDQARQRQIWLELSQAQKFPMVCAHLGPVKV